MPDFGRCRQNLIFMKKNNKFNLIIFFFIFVLGFFLRFYHLGSNPPGLYVDEAALGYNAYSILETGRDEYGKILPLFFRSFADYKMPLYIYLSVLPIKLLGLNTFSVRCLSALSGTLSIFLIFGLVKLLFREKNKGFWLTAAFVFSFLPWSVFMSRAAFEANLALFWLLLGVFLQLLSFEKDDCRYFFLAAFSYLLSAYSYHAERFLSPIIFLSLSFLWLRIDFRKDRLVKLLPGMLVFLLLFLPQLWLFSSPAGQARIKALLGSPGEIKFLLARYTSYFSPRNLFFDPDPDLQRSYPQLSVFYSWMVIPFFLGLFSFLRKPRDWRKWVIVLFLLFSPLPAAFAGDPFSALRAYPLIFPLILIITLGIEQCWQKLKSAWLKILVVFLTIGISFFSLYRNSFILLPKERFSAWSYGYKLLADQLLKKGEPVLIDDPLGSSYIELLFFEQYPPAFLHQERPKVDLSRYYDLGEWERQVSWRNFEVRGIFWEKDVYENKLIVATPLAVSADQVKEHFFTKAFAILGSDGRAIFNGYQTNPGLKREDDRKKLQLVK